MPLHFHLPQFKTSITEYQVSWDRYNESFLHVIQILQSELQYLREEERLSVMSVTGSTIEDENVVSLVPPPPFQPLTKPFPPLLLTNSAITIPENHLQHNPTKPKPMAEKVLTPASSVTQMEKAQTGFGNNSKVQLANTCAPTFALSAELQPEEIPPPEPPNLVALRHLLQHPRFKSRPLVSNSPMSYPMVLAPTRPCSATFPLPSPPPFQPTGAQGHISHNLVTVAARYTEPTELAVKIPDRSSPPSSPSRSQLLLHFGFDPGGTRAVAYHHAAMRRRWRLLSTVGWSTANATRFQLPKSPESQVPCHLSPLKLQPWEVGVARGIRKRKGDTF